MRFSQKKINSRKMSKKIMCIVEMKGEGEYNRHIRKDSCQFFYENLI